MKQFIITLFLFLLFFFRGNAQLGLPSVNAANGHTTTFIYGLRAGLNIANVSDRYATGNGSRFGMMAGIYADNSFNRFIGNRTELTYSRQDFTFRNSNANGKVDMQYLYVANLFALNIGHLLQVHIGPQVGYLVTAIADTIRNLNNGNVTDFFSIKGQTNRLNFGGCVGAEVYPWKGLLLGIRYNISFSSFNKREATGTFYDRTVVSHSSVYTGSNARLRHEMLQITCGWRLGNTSR